MKFILEMYQIPSNRISWTLPSPQCELFASTKQLQTTETQTYIRLKSFPVLAIVLSNYTPSNSQRSNF